MCVIHVMMIWKHWSKSGVSKLFLLILYDSKYFFLVIHYKNQSTPPLRNKNRQYELFYIGHAPIKLCQKRLQGGWPTSLFAEPWYKSSSTVSGTQWALGSWQLCNLHVVSPYPSQQTQSFMAPEIQSPFYHSYLPKYSKLPITMPQKLLGLSLCCQHTNN